MAKANKNTVSAGIAGAVLVALALLAPAASAQGHACLTVRSVGMVSGPGLPQIEVKTSGPVSPATQAVTGPDRIVVDFPGALPADTLHALAVHRGGLKAVRIGLFQSKPPITRVVLDVDGPTDYQVVPSGNSIVIKLGRPDGGKEVAATNIAPVIETKIETRIEKKAETNRSAPVKAAMSAPLPKPIRSVRMPDTRLPDLQVVNTVATAVVPRVQPSAVQPGGVSQTAAPQSVVPQTIVPQNKVDVGVHSNLLSIRAQGATLAEVLYEVHRRTGADIAIPAGAEQERVVVNLPSAPGRDTIASLLNGSRFNYIVMGRDTDPGGFRNILLSVKEGSGSSGVFVHNDPPPAGVPQSMPPPTEPAMDQSQMDPTGIPQPAPELEPIPEDTSANEPETSPDNPRPVTPQQVPIQNVPEAGQVPQ